MTSDSPDKTTKAKSLPRRFLQKTLSPLFTWARQESISAVVVVGPTVEPVTPPWLREALLEHLQLNLGTAGPEQADLLVVVGEVSQKLAPVLRETWSKMAAPSWILQIGVVSTTQNCSYALVERLEEVIPVDVRIEGLPPSETALKNGLEALRQRIRESSF